MGSRTILAVIGAVLVLALYLIANVEGSEANEIIKKPTSIGSLRNFFGSLRRASSRGLSFASNLLVSIPFTKILVAGGALLSLFFIFVRLIVVLGPILLLGAMTRESTDASDLLKMLIEFYNQIILALDEQTSQPAATTN